jgi:hypothetical protein
VACDSVEISTSLLQAARCPTHDMDTTFIPSPITPTCHHYEHQAVAPHSTARHKNRTQPPLNPSQTTAGGDKGAQSTAMHAAQSGVAGCEEDAPETTVVPEQGLGTREVSPLTAHK